MTEQTPYEPLEPKKKPKSKTTYPTWMVVLAVIIIVLLLPFILLFIVALLPFATICFVAHSITSMVHDNKKNKLTQELKLYSNLNYIKFKLKMEQLNTNSKIESI